MKTKTSALKLAIFEKPPYYEHEIITNLEELSLSSSQGNKQLNKNFEQINHVLDNASNKVISSIRDEAERSRIQSAIENERIAEGISETNYRLLDVASGIENLGNIVSHGHENIVESIYQSSKEVIEGLSTINDSLRSIDFRINMVNNSLNAISNQMGELLKKISAPNETQALELADQVRINLSLNKKETALKVARNALELSNGTSITVLAYHILTLSLFDDETLQNEMVQIYNDYINLVGFKLSDRQSDTTVVIQEVDNTLYPVLATMGYSTDSTILSQTQKLYTKLYENSKKIENILKKPISNDTALEMIDHPNRLREYHWSILLKEFVLTKQDHEIYIDFIIALAKSKVVIKNELMILAVKHFNKEGFLYADIIDGIPDSDNDKLHDMLRIVISLLPQDIIDIDHKTYWLMSVYVDKYDIKANEQLQSKFNKAIAFVNTDLNDRYLVAFKNIQQQSISKKKEINSQIESMRQEYYKALQTRMSEWGNHNKAIANQDYENKINNTRKTINKLQGKTYDIITALAPIFGVIGFFVGIISFNYFLPSSSSIGSIVFGLLYIVFALVGIPIIFGSFPYMLSKILEDVNSDKISELESNVLKYKQGLAKKYNVETKKEELDDKYNRKISALREELKSYRDKTVAKLDELLNEVCEHYTNSKTEPEKVRSIIEKQAPIYGKNSIGL